MMTKKEMLEALGVHTSEDRFWMGMLAGVGVGALVGGVVALLFAPSSGSELRRSIKEKGRHLVDRARHRAESLAEEAEAIATNT